jgi:hypothetical protein
MMTWKPGFFKKSGFYGCTWLETTHEAVTCMIGPVG